MPNTILRLYRSLIKRAGKRESKKEDVELSLNYINEPKNLVGHQYDGDLATSTLIKNMSKRIEMLEKEFKKLNMSRSVYSYKYNRF